MQIAEMFESQAKEYNEDIHVMWLALYAVIEPSTLESIEKIQSHWR